MRELWIALVAIATALGTRADVLELTDGRVLEGEVVGEATEYLDFRVMVGGLTSVVRIDRATIVRHDVAPLSTQPAPAPSAESGQVQPAGAPTVAVIPMHGRIGGLNRGRLAGTIQPEHLSASFERLRMHDTRLVILDIDCEGGDVPTQQEICRIIREWSDEFTIVAWPDDAIGPAAVIALSCDQIIVRPTTRLGAATIFEGEPDLHEQSAILATNRSFVTDAGQPFEIIEAMAGTRPELWWSPIAGFANRKASEDALQIDDGTRICTITGAEAIKYGLAFWMAETPEMVCQSVGVRGEYRILSIETLIDEINAKHESRLRAFDDCVAEYRQLLTRIAEALRTTPEPGNVSEHRADISRMITSVVVCRRRLGLMDCEMYARALGYSADLPDHVAHDHQLIADIRDAHLKGGATAMARAQESIKAALAATAKRKDR